LNIFRILFLLIFILGFSQIQAKQVKMQLNNVVVLSNCDQVIKDEYQRKCINFKAKKPNFNFYYITSTIVKGSIKKRLSFKDDKRLKVPNYIKCYYKSHFDRGHLAPDATFDYNISLLRTTYLSSNIVPERPYVNRYLISKIEKEFRKLIIKYGEAYIITGAHYKYQNNYKFNPNNKYHLNCGYYPDYIYKIIYIPKINKRYTYIITNEKPYKIIKLNVIQNIRFLKENKIIIKTNSFKERRNLWKIK